MPMNEEIIDVGDTVLCDMCNDDFTNSDEKGGFLFGSSAVCPRCTPDMEKNIAHYKEEEYIKDRARPDESFKDFVMRLRNGDNRIIISSLE